MDIKQLFPKLLLLILLLNLLKKGGRNGHRLTATRPNISD